MLFVSHKISPLTVMLRFVTTLVRKSVNTSAMAKVTFIGSLHSVESNFCVSLFKKREKNYFENLGPKNISDYKTFWKLID